MSRCHESDVAPMNTLDTTDVLVQEIDFNLEESSANSCSAMMLSVRSWATHQLSASCTSHVFHENKTKEGCGPLDSMWILDMPLQFNMNYPPGRIISGNPILRATAVDRSIRCENSFWTWAKSPGRSFRETQRP